MFGLIPSMESRDSNGTRLVVGQSVYSKTHARVGQLMGVTEPGGICTVRFNGSGNVATVKAEQLTVASWKQVRETRKLAELEQAEAEAGN